MGEQAELAAAQEDQEMAEDQLLDALMMSEPPFCAWCGGTCECDDWAEWYGDDE